MDAKCRDAIWRICQFPIYNAEDGVQATSTAQQLWLSVLHSPDTHRSGLDSCGQRDRSILGKCTVQLHSAIGILFADSTPPWTTGGLWWQVWVQAFTIQGVLRHIACLLPRETHLGPGATICSTCTKIGILQIFEGLLCRQAVQNLESASQQP